MKKYRKIVLGVIFGLIVGVTISYVYLGIYKQEKIEDCNDFAIAYLDLATEKYNISSTSNSEKWSEVIDVETEIHKMCQNQLEFY